MMEGIGARGRNRLMLGALVAFLLFVLYLAFLVFRPFVLDCVVAASVALLLAPLQKTLQAKLGGRRTLAAGLLVVACSVIVLVPVFSLGALIGKEAGNVLVWARPYLDPQTVARLWRETLPERLPWLSQWIRAGEDQATSLITQALTVVGGAVNQLVQATITGVTSALFDLLIFLLILFFLLRDGGQLRTEIRKLSPLPQPQEDEVLRHLVRTVKGVLLAMALVPVAQGILATIGFWLFGVPQCVLWGVMVVLAAFIPLLGSPLGWVPACIYLFVTGSPGKAVGLLLYGTAIISTIDNVLKPYLLREAAQIHPLLGFLSILGGLLAFGPLGFLVGPVILSLGLSALRIYRFLTTPSPPPAPHPSAVA